MEPGNGKGGSFGEDVGKELATWLKEVGRRQWRRSGPPSTHGGREDVGEGGRTPVVRDAVMLLCTLLAFLQYYFLDVNLQIARLPSTVIFVPAGAPLYWKDPDRFGLLGREPNRSGAPSRSRSRAPRYGRFWKLPGTDDGHIAPRAATADLVTGQSAGHRTAGHARASITPQFA